MNLLLLLLAMLSALTGVGAVARAPEPAAAAAVSVAPQAAENAAVAASRPHQDCPPLTRVAWHMEAAGFMLPAFAPLYASRRRE
jgi:hypothetical protein